MRTLEYFYTKFERCQAFFGEFLGGEEIKQRGRWGKSEMERNTVTSYQ
jgi:hypothetical protein